MIASRPVEDTIEVVRGAPYSGQDVQNILENRRAKVYKKPGTL